MSIRSPRHVVFFSQLARDLAKRVRGIDARMTTHAGDFPVRKARLGQVVERDPGDAFAVFVALHALKNHVAQLGFRNQIFDALFCHVGHHRLKLRGAETVTDRPSPRRAEFDQITMGWGSDDFEDLGARVELVAEFKASQCGLLPAEDKIVLAMMKRWALLGQAKAGAGA